MKCNACLLMRYQDERAGELMLLMKMAFRCVMNILLFRRDDHDVLLRSLCIVSNTVLYCIIIS